MLWKRAGCFLIPISLFLALPWTGLSAPNGAVSARGVLYEDDILCGPISLALVSEMMGGAADAQQIANGVSLSRKGTTLADLAAAASKLGLQAEGFHLRSPHQLSCLRGTSRAIVLLLKKDSDIDHFAVVWPAHEGGLWMAEYPKPARRVLPVDLLGELDMRVLVVQRADSPPPFAPPARSHWLLPFAFVVGFLVSFSLFMMIRNSTIRNRAIE